MRKLSIILLVFLVSCSPKLSTLTGDRVLTNSTSANIYVFGKNQDLLNDYELIGTIKMQGNLFTSKYRTDQSINLLKKGANYLGGNAIKIINIQFPKGPFYSQSYDIEADVFKITQIPDSIFEFATDTTKKEGIVINLYRPNKVFGSAVSYPVYINNYYVGGLENKEKMILILKDKSKKYFLELESYNELYKIPIIFRENVINIRCTVGMNAIPKIQIE